MFGLNQDLLADGVSRCATEGTEQGAWGRDADWSVWWLTAILDPRA